jgi:hypothetical protein
MLVPEAPPWAMFGHLCLAVAGWAAAELVAWEVATWEVAAWEVAAECDFTVAECPVVAALAMPRLSTRVAPSAPAPTAVPISGRVILTWFSFVSPGRSPGRAGLARGDQ